MPERKNRELAKEWTSTTRSLVGQAARLTKEDSRKTDEQIESLNRLRRGVKKSGRDIPRTLRAVQALRTEFGVATSGAVKKLSHDIVSYARLPGSLERPAARQSVLTPSFLFVGELKGNIFHYLINFLKQALN